MLMAMDLVNQIDNQTFCLCNFRRRGQWDGAVACRVMVRHLRARLAGQRQGVSSYSSRMSSSSIHTTTVYASI